MKYIRLITLLAVMLLPEMANAQTEEVIYYPKLPQVELSDAKTRLKNLLENIPVRDKSVDYGSLLEDVSVFDDRIEMTYEPSDLELTIYFSDILDDYIAVIRHLDASLTDGGYDKFEFRNFTFFGRLKIINIGYARELADYLFYFQHRLNAQRYDSLISIFKPIAEKYRSLKEKPLVSEEQRKYIVQANGFNEQKIYKKAIELYKKAIEVDQTAYTAAYSNLALLSAQVGKFDAAIFYMKKYLMLEPDVTDARSAQDKIYLWEAQIVN